MGTPQAYYTLVSAMSVGDAFTPYNAANAVLGVGDSSAAFAIGQTDLQAATNKIRKGMEVGYPSRINATTVEFQALYGETEANHDWNEYALFNHPSAGTMMFREVEALGSKAVDTIWRFTISIEWLKT